MKAFTLLFTILLISVNYSFALTDTTTYITDTDDAGNTSQVLSQLLFYEGYWLCESKIAWLSYWP